MAKITIYTTPTCAYCKMAKEYFKSKGLEWEEKNVATDVQAQQEMIAKSGQLGVPVIDIDGKIVVGFDRPRINEYLEIHRRNFLLKIRLVLAPSRSVSLPRRHAALL